MAFLLCVPLAAGTLGAVSACTPDDAGDGSGGTVAQSETADAEPVSFTGLDQVTVTDGYAVNALEKEADYLLLLDADRLLAGFYANSSLGSNGSSMYGGGWEGALIGGHTMGHYLSALSQAVANAGMPEDCRAELAQKLGYIVDELKKASGRIRCGARREGGLSLGGEGRQRGECGDSVRQRGARCWPI